MTMLVRLPGVTYRIARGAVERLAGSGILAQIRGAPYGRTLVARAIMDQVDEGTG